MQKLNSFASAAGLTRAKKKFHFDVTFRLQDLVNCTYVTGVLFVKLRLKEGGSYTESSRRCDIRNHRVRWDQDFKFHCKMVASHSTAELEPCTCKVSIRKETRGGRSYKKLGYAKINLAEYAGAGETQRRYLLESYNESKHKPDNSILKVTISLKQTSGDSVFKAPHARVWELNETEDEGIQPDFQHGSRLSSIVSHPRTSTASSLSGGSVVGMTIGGGSLSLQDMRKRSGSGEEAKKTSSSVGSLREERAKEIVTSGDEEETFSRHSSECITEEETQSTVTPHSLPSENGSQEKTPRNSSPSLRTTRSNSLGSGDTKMRPQLPSVTTETGIQSLPNRSQAHRRHTSFSGVANSQQKLHKRNQSLLSGQSSKSTSAYSTLSDRSMRSWESQDIESISGSTRKLAIVPTSSKVESSRVNTMEVINKLFEGQTFDAGDQEEQTGLQLFVDKTRGTVTVGGSELDKKFHLQAVDVTGTIAHSRSSSGGGSPRPPRRKTSSGNLQSNSPRESVSSLVTTHGKPTR